MAVLKELWPLVSASNVDDASMYYHSYALFILFVQ